MFLLRHVSCSKRKKKDEIEREVGGLKARNNTRYINIRPGTNSHFPKQWTPAIRYRNLYL